MRTKRWPRGGGKKKSYPTQKNILTIFAVPQQEPCRTQLQGLEDFAEKFPRPAIVFGRERALDCGLLHRG
ncbi:MAG: hypothetical protein WCK89_21085, partial [bacterium]